MSATDTDTFPSRNPVIAALQTEVSELRRRLQQTLDCQEQLCRALEQLESESEGVAGLHRNGDVASWESLRRGGAYEPWLLVLDEALDNLERNGRSTARKEPA